MSEKYYAWSFGDILSFDETYETIEECLEKAKESNENNKIIVYVGETVEYKSSIDGISVIEELQRDADRDLEEIAENFLVNVSREKIAELEKGLNKVYHEWLTKNNLKLDYITAIKKYNLITSEFLGYMQEGECLF